MKLLDAIYEMNRLNRSISQPEGSSFVTCEEMVKAEKSRLMKEYSECERLMEQYEQLSNRVFEKLATNYVTVEGKRYSLQTLSNILGVAQFRFTDVITGNDFNEDCFFDSCTSPRQRCLTALDFKYYPCCSSVGVFPMASNILVDPYEREGKRELLWDTFAAKARSILVKALCDIDLT